MEVELLACGDERCRFCGECHSVGECSFARPKYDPARWATMVDVLQMCGYSVTVGQGYVLAEAGMEQVAFVMRPEGLVAAEQWVEVNALPKLLGLLEEATRLSWWDVVKGVWRSLWGR